MAVAIRARGGRADTVDLAIHRASTFDLEAIYTARPRAETLLWGSSQAPRTEEEDDSLFDHPDDDCDGED